MDNANLKPSMEGGLEKPTRHIIDWKNPDFLNEEKYEELCSSKLKVFYRNIIFIKWCVESGLDKYIKENLKN